MTRGASRLTTFRQIIMPLLFPTVVAVWVQLFILGANEFTLAAFLSTPQSQPLSMYLYGRINPEDGQLYAPNQGAAMALIFTVMVLLASYGLNLAGSVWRVAGSPNSEPAGSGGLRAGPCRAGRALRAAWQSLAPSPRAGSGG